ncbi:MAG: serine hydrolase, partial [Saprospiraceae bacterium]|nr:serine hydrolase [Saprospiraceae bacterium]
HLAAGEPANMRNNKNRLLGSAPNVPGTIWAYNNWDYNTLISIFEQQTGISEKEAFIANISNPLKMEDITDSTVEYSIDTKISSHPIIQYNLSARDMLKFGKLCLNKGNWEGKQIVPETYFNKIVTDYTKTGFRGLRSGHGYLWWVPFDKSARAFGLPKGTFYAEGMGKQQIIIIPSWETVIVHKSNTNYRKGFSMWLDQEGFTLSDSIYVYYNLQVLQDEFLDFVINKCKDEVNINNPICETCKLVGNVDCQKFLAMILKARN